MAISISELWRLLMESRLLTHEQCQHLSAEFAQSRPASPPTGASELAEWLIARNVISPYQSRLLLAGRPGPFFYGDYVIYDRIDRGRFAGAFRAVHAGTSHPVLLQFLTGALIDDDATWQSYLTWAETECGLIHPRWQRCFEVVDLDDYRFLVLEEVYGHALADQLTQGPLPWPEACRIVREAALALHDLHQLGRVHGDVRPKNVFLEAGGHVKIARDFASPPGPFPWGAPDPKGDLLDRTNYLAPEMGQTGRAPDVLTDVYALGCLLYTTVAGRPPFNDGDMLQKMQLHATARIQPLEEFGAPPQLGQIVAYMMAKNPQLRFQEVAHVAEQLAAFINPTQLQTHPPTPLPTLAAFDHHLHAKREATIQRRHATRRAAPVGATAPVLAGGGRGVAATATSSGPRSGGMPDFSTLGKSSAAATATASPAPTRVGRRKSSGMTPGKLAAILGSAAALLIAILVGLSFLGGDETPTPQDAPTLSDGADSTAPNNQLAQGSSHASDAAATSTQPPKVEPPATPLPETTGSTHEVVADDGTLPWASPTNGPPIDLSYLPSGSQMFAAFRPADLLASQHGAAVMQALGPRFDTWVKTWEDGAGFKLNEVEQITLALYENSGNPPRAAIVVRLKSPLDEATLLSRWGNPPPKQQGGGTTYSAKGWSFYVPTNQPGVFLMGSASEVEEVAKNPQTQPLLGREMERLLRVSDSQRHVSVLFAPNFLFYDAQKLFSGDFQKLREPVQDFLGDGLQASLASVHFGEPFYVEMRLAGTLDRDKRQLASDMQERLAQLPNQVEDYVARLVPHPYWRKLALRFPSMIRFLHQQTRIAAEGDHAIINAALPGKAAPNLIAASELTLVSQPGAAYVADTAPAKRGFKDLNELLEYKFSLSFPQQSLDFAMRDVATEVRDGNPDLPFPFDIKILGKDLEMNGITQNQSIRDFEARDKPLKEVLTALVMKANPITTVKAPNEPDQKLIWVVGPDPADPTKKVILITTRDAAAAKNYELPDAFK